MPAIMDHRDRIRQDRELLGRENFSSFTLDEFLHEIDLKYPTQISKKRVLLLFVTWLHDCLLSCLVNSRDLDKSENTLLRPKIQEWLSFLRKCNNSDQIIRDTFKEWQRDEALKRDRDYQIKLKTIDIEFDYVLEQFPSTTSVPSSASARAPAVDATYHGTIHPDRMKIHKFPYEEGELDEDDDNVQVQTPSAGDTFPSNLGTRHKKKRKQKNGAKKTDPVSFLTGSNRMVFDDNMSAFTAGWRMMSHNASSQQKHKQPLQTNAAIDSKRSLSTVGGYQATQLSPAIGSGSMVADQRSSSSVTDVIAGGPKSNEHPNTDGVTPMIHPQRMMMLESTDIDQNMEPDESPKLASDLSFLTGTNRMVLQDAAIRPKRGYRSPALDASFEPTQEPSGTQRYQTVAGNKTRLPAFGDRYRNKVEAVNDNGSLSVHPDRLMILDEYKPSPAGSDPAPLDSEPTQSPSGLSFLTGSNRMVFDKDAPPSTTKPRKKARQKAKASEWTFDVKKRAFNEDIFRRHVDEEDDVGHYSKKPRVGDRVCQLCGGDHFLAKDCPAKLDPHDGSAPYKTYKCGLCQAVGSHYTLDCPQKFVSLKEKSDDYWATWRGGHQPSASKSDSVDDLGLQSTSEKGTRASFSEPHGFRTPDDVSRGGISVKRLAKRPKASISHDGHGKDRGWSTIHVGAQDDVIFLSENRNEGRLSYHDVGNGSASASPTSNGPGAALSTTSVIQATVVGGSEGDRMVETKRREEQLDGLVSELILLESTKSTWLLRGEIDSNKTEIAQLSDENAGNGQLFLIHRRDPPWNPVILELFKGKKIKWIPRTRRPRAVDYITFAADAEDAPQDQYKEKGIGLDTVMEDVDWGMEVDCPEQPHHSVEEEQAQGVAYPEPKMDVDEYLQPSAQGQWAIAGESMDVMVEDDQPHNTDGVAAAAWTLDIGSPGQQDAEKAGLLSRSGKSVTTYEAEAFVYLTIDDEHNDIISTDRDDDHVMTTNEDTAAPASEYAPAAHDH
ncbi:hypothetical protein QBC38DRAFT_63481 [Podospora fimiseda]|uniref:Zinc knuckle CX2CX3GHX4C domain-containing protein n=1 Tax=Podospora fimiseda TaxID=252190 RepID=A0AAN7BV86_9PEZI|nr:hypothetical protein QBC38DRAFT_63481 [Podospora fimiseda]